MRRVGRLFETELFEADDGRRDLTLLVSDLHLPSTGRVPRELARFLDEASARGERARVCVLGDLFDAYVTDRQSGAGICAEVASLFARCARAGVSVHCLHGNRDFLLGRRFSAAASCRVVPGGLFCEVARSRCLLLHGDELCRNDLPYQRAKRRLRSAWVRAASRALPLFVAEKLAARARQKSMDAIASGDQDRFDPTREALDAAFRAGADLVVFGHVHRLGAGELDGRPYRVLPAFDESAVGLRAEGGQWRFVSARTGYLAAVPEPGPIRLA
ncbi:MAG: hypothetical protein Fur0037_27430 [Planctomycetota bacterium]